MKEKFNGGQLCAEWGGQFHADSPAERNMLINNDLFVKTSLQEYL